MAFRLENKCENLATPVAEIFGWFFFLPNKLKKTFLSKSDGNEF